MSWIDSLFGRASKAEGAPPESIMMLIDHEREAYRTVLLQLYDSLRSQECEIFPEVQIKFDRAGVPEPYLLSRLDAVYKNEEKVGPAEANIKVPWSFRPVSENWGGLSVTAYPLVWNGVEFRVSGPLPDQEAIFAWLAKWYDPEDKQVADADGLHGVVHHITDPQKSSGGWLVSIDFGSGPLAAFTEFIEVIRSTGASKLEIGSFSYGHSSVA